jgi:hypothetical protein
MLFGIGRFAAIVGLSATSARSFVRSLLDRGEKPLSILTWCCSGPVSGSLAVLD